MEREILEGHVAALQAIRARMNGLANEAGDGKYNVIADAVESVAGIVEGMAADAIRFADHMAELKRKFEEAQGPSEHAKNVADLMAPNHRVPADPRD
jgi:hypothetical protein